MSELPSTWVTTCLGSVIELNPKNTEIPDETLVGFVPMALLGKSYLDSVTFQAKPWAEVKRGYSHFRDGDVLLAKITPCFENGKAGLAIGLPNGMGAGSTEYFVCRPKAGMVNARYLLAFLKRSEFLSIGAARMTGSVGHKRVPKEYLSESSFPLAPINEQTRIAVQLDKLLARIQSCNDRLDAVPALLKRFRQAVLTAAIKGELIEGVATPDWRPCTVGDLLEGKPRNGYSPKAVDFETPVRSLTLSATTSGRFLAQHSKFIDEQIPDGSHLWLEPGDILIQRANTLEYVGVSAIFDGPSKQFIYPDLMMKCRPNQLILRKFLFYTLSAEQTRQYFRDQATGTAGNMPKINQQTVMSAPVFLPSLEEQERIVLKVDAFFQLADRIEARYTAARTQAQRLSPLLLAKAFRGELVPQDPNDEPASALLERIHAAKAEPSAKSRRGRQPKVAHTDS